ncbi:hypothetical protein CHCC20488_1521 [Bacillus paralicheniformis]|nr:hypothetical protein CHCC20497_1308 [Bacillus paralicheniformis]TWK27932.1 hypothetical protein CHCC20372_3183 [Bacillus paralicheniformis]TWN41669.1 hypothetical protein CHCC14523_0723 [Bacillus paralicheniformis]TWN89149.1 hypothetical protein CHCC20492_1939 [Bacillus paralicheniformis]TWN99733.1 hypothetical protein CHCC20488_1521 [Bacillus paralicheniformis]
MQLSFSLSFQRASFFLPRAIKNRRQKKTYIVSTACGESRMSVYSDLMRAKSIGKEGHEFFHRLNEP